MKKASPAASLTPTAEYLQGVVARQMDMLSAYKSRQDDIVRALGSLQKLIRLGALEAVETAIADLLARDLKQAKDRKDNEAFALNIAVKALEHAHACDDRDDGIAQDALSQIELLVPDAFTPHVAAGVAS